MILTSNKWTLDQQKGKFSECCVTKKLKVGKGQGKIKSKMGGKEDGGYVGCCGAEIGQSTTVYSIEVECYKLCLLFALYRVVAVYANICHMPAKNVSPNSPSTVIVAPKLCMESGMWTDW